MNRCYAMLFALIVLSAPVLSQERLTETKKAPSAEKSSDFLVLGYFSSKALAPRAFRRQTLALEAMHQAKKPVSEGGLGAGGGFRDIEDEKIYKDFVHYCGEGEAQAASYLSLVRRGCVVIVLTDGEEQKWYYGPALLNEAMDGFGQIAFMDSEHQRMELLEINARAGVVVPDICVIAYYSAKASSKYATGRHALAKRAIDRVQKSVKEGGLGVPAGLRDVEAADSWKDFVSKCAEGEAEATSLLPHLRRGGVVIVIAD